MTEPTGPDRLTKPETAAALGCSERTVEQLVKVGKLDPRRWRPSAGGQWRTVFLAEDVARLAAERRGGPPTPFLMPPTAGPGNGNGHQAHLEQKKFQAELPSGEDVLRLVFTMAQRALTGAGSLEGPKEDPKGPQGPQEGPNVPQDPKAYLTLTEAAAEKRVSEAMVRRWMRRGVLRFEREPRSQWTPEDRGWRIRRDHLKAC